MIESSWVFTSVLFVELSNNKLLKLITSSEFKLKFKLKSSIKVKDYWT